MAMHYGTVYDYLPSFRASSFTHPPGLLNHPVPPYVHTRFSAAFGYTWLKAQSVIIAPTSGLASSSSFWIPTLVCSGLYLERFWSTLHILDGGLVAFTLAWCYGAGVLGQIKMDGSA